MHTNQLEVKHLRMICAIAETGNMTRAAGMLHITQSALSQQLKDIEGKLKADLFFRTSKKMILTPIGKNLAKKAVQIIETIEDAELEIAKTVSGDRGELKVGAHCVFCYKWLPRVMRIFQGKFPNIEFEIGNSYDPPRELEDKKYDLIITVVPVPDDRFFFRSLFSDRMVCIMPKDHPLSARSFVRLEDFGGCSLIAHSEEATNRFYQLFLKPKGIHPKRMMAVGPPQAIIEMVASGFGISVVPGWAMGKSTEAERITVRPITKGGFPVTWNAAMLKNHQTPVFHREFINIIGKMNIE